MNNFPSNSNVENEMQKLWESFQEEFEYNEDSDTINNLLINDPDEDEEENEEYFDIYKIDEENYDNNN